MAELEPAAQLDRSPASGLFRANVLPAYEALESGLPLQRLIGSC